MFEGVAFKDRKLGLPTAALLPFESLHEWETVVVGLGTRTKGPYNEADQDERSRAAMCVWVCVCVCVVSSQGGESPLIHFGRRLKLGSSKPGATSADTAAIQRTVL